MIDGRLHTLLGNITRKTGELLEQSRGVAVLRGGTNRQHHRQRLEQQLEAASARALTDLYLLVTEVVFFPVAAIGFGIWRVLGDRRGHEALTNLGDDFKSLLTFIEGNPYSLAVNLQAVERLRAWEVNAGIRHTLDRP